MTTPVLPVGTIDPTTAPPAATAAATSSGPSSSLLDPQAFLQLLVAQLRYQDPSNPVDTSSFMNQTATLSQVQTMTSMSSTLTALVSAQQAQSATAMIGKQITYADPTGVQVHGVVTSVSLLSSGPALRVAGTTVPLSSVLEVSDPPAAT